MVGVMRHCLDRKKGKWEVEQVWEVVDPSISNVSRDLIPVSSPLPSEFCISKMGDSSTQRKLAPGQGNKNSLTMTTHL